MLIRVHYAGLNPVDYKTRNGMLRVVQPYSLPVTMGNEVAGDIAAVGANVAGWAAGDEVLVRLAKERIGGFAGYVATDASKWPASRPHCRWTSRRRAAGRADRLAVSVRIWPHR